MENEQIGVQTRSPTESGPGRRPPACEVSGQTPTQNGQFPLILGRHARGRCQTAAKPLARGDGVIWQSSRAKTKETEAKFDEMFHRPRGLVRPLLGHERGQLHEALAPVRTVPHFIFSNLIAHLEPEQRPALYEFLVGLCSFGSKKIAQKWSVSAAVRDATS